MKQKALAARILKCGQSRVWFDPGRAAEIEEAITAEDMRRLVRDGIVRRAQKKGLSSYRKKLVAAQKKKGRRRGKGSRKGAIGTRLPAKRRWMSSVRAIRSLLAELKAGKRIDNAVYRDAYRKTKSGFFRSRSHVMIYLERNNLLREESAGKK